MILRIKSHNDHVAFTSVVMATTKTTTITTTRATDYQSHAHHQKTNSTQKTVTCDEKKSQIEKNHIENTSIMFI